MAYHHQSTPEAAAVAQLLLASHPTLLSFDEIHRATGDPDLKGTLAHLVGAGLAHELGYGEGGFFWASRAFMAGEEASTALPA